MRKKNAFRDMPTELTSTHVKETPTGRITVISSFNKKCSWISWETGWQRGGR
jgi:hypothetical protein